LLVKTVPNDSCRDMKFALFVISLFLTASSVAAQTPSLFTVCVQNLDRERKICGYDPTADDPLVASYNAIGQGARHFSLAGRKLITGLPGSAPGQFDIWVSNPDGKELKKLTTIIGPDQNNLRVFAVSKDLKKVAYVWDGGKLFVKDLDDNSTVLLEDEGAQHLTGISLSPSGDRVAYQLFTQGDLFRRLMIARTDTSEAPFPLTNFTPPADGAQERTPVWSFDGEFIVFVRSIAGPGPSIMRITTDGSRQENLIRPYLDEVTNGLALNGDATRLGFLSRDGVNSIGIDGKNEVLIRADNNGAPTNSFEMIGWTGSDGLIVTDPGSGGDANSSDGLCDADTSSPGEQCTLRAAI